MEAENLFSQSLCKITKNFGFNKNRLLSFQILNRFISVEYMSIFTYNAINILFSSGFYKSIASLTLTIVPEPKVKKHANNPSLRILHLQHSEL